MKVCGTVSLSVVRLGNEVQSYSHQSHEREISTSETAGNLCFPDGNAWAWLRSGIIPFSRTKRGVSLVM